MASNRAKALRRGKALNRLDQLARELGEKLKVPVPNVRPVSPDPELEQIIQLEAVNYLLASSLVAMGRKTKAA